MTHLLATEIMTEPTPIRLACRVPSGAVSLVQCRGQSQRSRSLACSDSLDGRDAQMALKRSRSRAFRANKARDFVQSLGDIQNLTALPTDFSSNDCGATFDKNQSNATSKRQRNTTTHPCKQNHMEELLNINENCSNRYWTPTAIEHWAADFDKVCQYCHGLLLNTPRSTFQSPLCRECIFLEFQNVLALLEEKGTLSKRMLQSLPPALQIRQRQAIVVQQQHIDNAALRLSVL